MDCIRWIIQNDWHLYIYDVACCWDWARSEASHCYSLQVLNVSFIFYEVVTLKQSITVSL